VQFTTDNQRTCGVGELILLSLYPVLERLGVATSYLNALLNGICTNVRHLAGRLVTNLSSNMRS
jgi:hypothetical protein